MERKFLKDLGIPEEAVEKIMAENGRDIAACKERVSGELEAARELARRAQSRELDAAAAVELARAGAKNTRAVKALLDLQGLAVEEDGSVPGLREQVDALKEDPETRFLFREPEPPRGFLPGEGRDGLPGTGAQLSLGEAVRSALLDAERNP